MTTRPSRVRRALRRFLDEKNRPLAVARIVNKTPLARAARGAVDFVHARSRRIRKELRPTLTDAVELQKLEELRVRGWTRLPDSWGPEERSGAGRLVDDLRARFSAGAEALPERYKTIWNYLSDKLDAEGGISDSSPLVRLALLSPVVRIVANYLGELPWLRYTLVTESVYQPGEPDYSQKWHLDFDDERMVKLFAYFTDVRDADDGPFELLDSTASAGLRNSFVRAHLDDSAVFRKLDRGSICSILGSRFTLFLADTHRVYHCGSRMAEGHSRLLYTALYTAYPSIYPGAKSAFKIGPQAGELDRLILSPQEATN